MTLRVLWAAGYVEQPWKNGGGVTREIALGPTGAGLANFDWRVSLADVSEFGPFSTFPGVDRTLTVLDGQLRLAFGEAAPITLTSGSPPLTFPADVVCHGFPVDGRALDLNVMVRRARYQAHVERLEGGDWRPAGRIALLVALGPVELAGDVGEWRLGRHDAIFSAAAHSAGALSVRGPSVTITLTALAA